MINGHESGILVSFDCHLWDNDFFITESAGERIAGPEIFRDYLGPAINAVVFEWHYFPSPETIFLLLSLNTNRGLDYQAPELSTKK
jgi:hypothetical protein